jgi:hypothetical protein
MNRKYQLGETTSVLLVVIILTVWTLVDLPGWIWKRLRQRSAVAEPKVAYVVGPGQRNHDLNDGCVPSHKEGTSFPPIVVRDGDTGEVAHRIGGFRLLGPMTQEEFEHRFPDWKPTHVVPASAGARSAREGR